jgi:hypothetical protein
MVPADGSAASGCPLFQFYSRMGPLLLSIDQQIVNKPFRVLMVWDFWKWWAEAVSCLQ